MSENCNCEDLCNELEQKRAHEIRMNWFGIANLSLRILGKFFDSGLLNKIYNSLVRKEKENKWQLLLAPLRRSDLS